VSCWERNVAVHSRWSQSLRWLEPHRPRPPDSLAYPAVVRTVAWITELLHQTGQTEVPLSLHTHMGPALHQQNASSHRSHSNTLITWICYILGLFSNLNLFNSTNLIFFQVQIQRLWQHGRWMEGRIGATLSTAQLVLFTVLLAHLILRISPHHSHHLHSHHLSLPRPFTPHLKLISFTNPFLHNLPGSYWTAFTDVQPVLN